MRGNRTATAVLRPQTGFEDRPGHQAHAFQVYVDSNTSLNDSGGGGGGAEPTGFLLQFWRHLLRVRQSNPVLGYPYLWLVPTGQRRNQSVCQMGVEPRGDPSFGHGELRALGPILRARFQRLQQEDACRFQLPGEGVEAAETRDLRAVPGHVRYLFWRRGHYEG